MTYPAQHPAMLRPQSLPRRVRWLCIAPLLCLVVVLCPAGRAVAAEVTYEKDVRPILKAYCFHCHGESTELAGGLDLRLRRLIAQGGESGETLTPGDPESSLLYQYVSSGEMPPEEDLQLKADDVETIRRWIAAGAPLAEPEPDHTPAPGEFYITPQERSHWAFQPIRKPDVPRIEIARGNHSPTIADHPVDAFLARKLVEHGLSFSRQADREALIRRATFDLTGLPPTRQEVARFVADDRPDAWSRLLDRLLQSPRYGERWGRHWLDVAGYADSEGYDDKDLVRDDAWQYRDYVIRSLNADKPWDQFIVEQLAGDELIGGTHSSVEKLANDDPRSLELLTATGFLRMAPDGTGSSPADPQQARNQVVSETLQIVSSSLLGITIGCAECHDHRFDPIPQEDFYRLRAVFEPAFNLTDWRMPKTRRVAILAPADKVKADEIETQARQLDEQHAELKNEVLQTILGRVLDGIPEEQREFARQAFATDEKERTPEQTEFVQEKFPMLGLLRPGALHLFLARFEDGEELKKKYESVLAEATRLRATKPSPQFVRVMTEQGGELPATFVFRRGDFTDPADEPVPPAGLSVLPASDQPLPDDDPSLPTSGRRLAYARYLTSGQHPLVARVLVNRFWMHHFGRGLVETAGEFGARSSGPSHPELLDWLAADFMEHGWRLKRLHRLIMTSHAYQQSSRRSADADAIDSDNRWLSRQSVRRLEAEAIRDAMLAVSGQLNREQFGPPVPVAVDAGGIVTVGDGNETVDPNELKRSVYVQVRRSQPVAMLEAFDTPQMEPNCEAREFSTVATQSLALLNSTFAVRQSEAFAERLLAEAGEDAAASELVDLAWQIALAVPPTPAVRDRMVLFLEQQQADYRNSGHQTPDRQALATLCQVLLGSSQFLYVE